MFLMEVFVKDLNKWIMVDPQFDAIAYLDGIPLNAVELQKAITEKKDIKIISSDKDFSSIEYQEWICSYLYYFSFNFDNRENIPNEDRLLVEGKRSLMLVPIGAKNPTIFQQLFPIDNCLYTNSVKDFYRSPF